MKADELEDRVKKFALRVIKLVESLPGTLTARHIGGQLLRAATSAAANYRAARRARSKKEFIAKIGIVVEESDESIFWMEMLIEAGIIKTELLTALLTEGTEILKIMSSSRKTAKTKSLITKSLNH
jgi:four helix bundle protein